MVLTLSPSVTTSVSLATRSRQRASRTSSRPTAAGGCIDGRGPPGGGPGRAINPQEDRCMEIRSHRSRRTTSSRHHRQSSCIGNERSAGSPRTSFWPGPLTPISFWQLSAALRNRASMPQARVTATRTSHPPDLHSTGHTPVVTQQPAHHELRVFARARVLPRQPDLVEAPAPRHRHPSVPGRRPITRVRVQLVSSTRASG